MPKKAITILTGNRRTGKTTLMYQLMDALVAGGVPRTRILYYSFDDERPSLRELVKAFEKHIGEEVLFSKKRYYLFLDEIQKLEDWQNKVKLYYDGPADIKFVLSGSSSLFIRRRTTESLAGRVREYSLGPLTFAEYLNFVDLGYMARDPAAFGEGLKERFLMYVPRQYIDLVAGEMGDVAPYVKGLVEKVIYVDIPALFAVDDPVLLLKLVKLLGSTPGMLLEYSSLATTLSTDVPVNRERISRYIHHLQDSYLLCLGYNHSGSGFASERRLKKGYLSNASLSFVGDAIPDITRLVEQTFFTALSAKFFWRTPQKHEVDIVLEWGGALLPVEVKFTDNLNRKDLKGLLHFMKKRKVGEGVLITNDTEDTLEEDAGTIRLIPAWKAALFGVDRTEQVMDKRDVDD
jgi:predicted AAA+ superfamily ATPase